MKTLAKLTLYAVSLKSTVYHPGDSSAAPNTSHILPPTKAPKGRIYWPAQISNQFSRVDRMPNAKRPHKCKPAKASHAMLMLSNSPRATAPSMTGPSRLRREGLESGARRRRFCLLSIPPPPVWTCVASRATKAVNHKINARLVARCVFVDGDLLLRMPSGSCEMIHPKRPILTSDFKMGFSSQLSTRGCLWGYAWTHN
jgi:hypothetical protein